MPNTQAPITPNTSSQDAAFSALLQSHGYTPPTPSAQPGGAPAKNWRSLVNAPAPQGYFSDYSKDVNATASKVDELASGTAPGEGTPVGDVVGGLELAGTVAGAIPTLAADLLPSPARGAAKAVLNVPGDVINWLGGKIADTKAAQDFVQAHPEATDALIQISKAGQALGTISGTILGAKGVAEGAQAGVGAATKVAQGFGETVKGMTSNLGDAIKNNNPEGVDNFIQTQYTKAIKPSMAGKTAPGQLDKYNANAVDAVKTIVNNKPNLELTDAEGDPVPSGKLPETIDQFRQAIEQTKANIFKQYDAIAKSAGEQGATVDLKPVAAELQKVADNKIVNDLHPDLANYAASRAKTLLARKSYSAEDAQTAVQNLNRSLDVFYRNPTYDTASRAGVDALIANQLRAGLNKTIEDTTGEAYQALKQKYGALSAIEKDVVKRNIAESRRTGGLVSSLGELATGEELIRGVLTMNPHALLTSAALQTVISARNYLMSPNRAVRILFQKADAATPSGVSPILAGQSSQSPTPPPETGASADQEPAQSAPSQ